MQTSFTAPTASISPRHAERIDSVELGRLLVLFPVSRVPHPFCSRLLRDLSGGRPSSVRREFSTLGLEQPNVLNSPLVLLPHAPRRGRGGLRRAGGRQGRAVCRAPARSDTRRSPSGGGRR